MSKFLPSSVSSILLLAASLGCSHSSEAHPATAPAAVAGAQTLEVGCGACVFHMPGVDGCPLAVEVDGKHYLVSGVEMPGHESGLCDHARTADLTGRLEGEQFVATSFSLKP
jgi:hypothetical protein